MIRIGHGYDAHRLVPGRPLILGGVMVAYERGLAGHSDADVLTHAVMDALLGAAALGDIGQHFPDNDPACRDASSIGLLREVTALICKAGYQVVNVDCTLLAQAPKLAPFRRDMAVNLELAMGLPNGRVSVKMTTEEGMGFTGAGEGMACHAVCLIMPKE